MKSRSNDLQSHNERLRGQIETLIEQCGRIIEKTREKKKIKHDAPVYH